MLGGLLLLHPPVFWLRGLPGPPDDSLRFPREAGLPTADGPGRNLGIEIEDKGSVWITDFVSFQPSAKKLPTITCNRRIQCYSTDEKTHGCVGASHSKAACSENRTYESLCSNALSFSGFYLYYQKQTLSLATRA